jgi:hypothetical protein
VVPRRRGGEAILLFHLPKPGRLILKSEHRRKSGSGPVPPADTCRPTGRQAAEHRRVAPLSLCACRFQAGPIRSGGRTLIARFARGMAGTLLAGL